ncbi:MAG: hydrolase, partial [Bordetella sp.]|nr:hydrolase [Bordetella sp.]
MSETKKRIWDDFLTERDKQVLAQAGYGKRGGFGKRPALFIIDVQYNFCGDKPEDILEGLKQY